jgi:hypothetical protein
MNGPGTGISFKGVVIFFAALILASTVHAEVDTGGLKLVDASGVPDGAIHSYMFQGSIVFYPTAKSGEFVSPYENFWGDGKGSWNQGSKEAEERFKFSGSLAGKLLVLFKCQKDPWLTTNAGCVFISTQYSGTSGKVYDWNLILKTRGRPLSTGAVTLAAATELSKKHVASGAPPPPPPNPQPKRDPLKIGDALVAPGGLKAAPGVAAALAKPNLGVVASRANIEPNCQPLKPAMTVKVTIRNSGGPLTENKGTVFLKEIGGANLSSGGVALPKLNSGQELVVSIPAISPQPYSSLAGQHKLQVLFNPQIEGGQPTFLYPAIPSVVEAAFPQNHCKSASRQPPGDSGNAAGTRGGVPTTPLLPSRSLNR